MPLSPFPAKGALASAAAMAALFAVTALPGAAAAQPEGYNGQYDSYQDCQNKKTGGTVAGAVVGGVLGAVLGSNIAAGGHRGDGSLVGGAAGAVVGGAVGNSATNCDDAPPPGPTMTIAAMDATVPATTRSRPLPRPTLMTAMATIAAARRPRLRPTRARAMAMNRARPRTPMAEAMTTAAPRRRTPRATIRTIAAATTAAISIRARPTSQATLPSPSGRGLHGPVHPNPSNVMAGPFLVPAIHRVTGRRRWRAPPSAIGDSYGRRCTRLSRHPPGLRRNGWPGLQEPGHDVAEWWDRSGPKWMAGTKEPGNDVAK